MGNLEKAGVGVVVTLLVIIMVVAFTTDPGTTPVDPSVGGQEETQGLDALRKNDTVASAADLNPPEPVVAPILPDPVEVLDDDLRKDAGMRVVRPEGDTGPLPNGLDAEPLPAVGEVPLSPDVAPLPAEPASDLESPVGEWPRRHVLKSGEKLWTIAAETYGTRYADRMAREIQRLNGIDDPRKLRANSTIKLPAPPTDQATGATKASASGSPPAAPAPRVSVPTLPWEPGPATWVTAADVEAGWYVVRENESLGRIAQEQCGSVKLVAAIVKLNGIKNPNQIRAGTRLRLPKKK